MNATERKKRAKEIIMDQIAGACSRIYDGHDATELSEEERKEIMGEIMKQADRAAKLFGYEEAWHN